MKNFLTMLLAIFILSVSVACAEVKTYTGSGEYFMTDETVDFAKNRAELSAQRNVLEKICVYIKGDSTLIDNELDTDEIITICAGILHVTDTKFQFTNDAAGIFIRATVTADIDIDQAEDLLNRAIAERIK